MRERVNGGTFQAPGLLSPGRRLAALEREVRRLSSVVRVHEETIQTQDALIEALDSENERLSSHVLFLLRESEGNA